MIKKIRKRDGRIVDFEKKKIANAIWAAAQAVGGKDRKRSDELTEEVVEIINKKFRRKIPSVEDVQDIVEKVLIEDGHARTAKAYILYREQHKNIREVTKLLRDIKIVEDYLEQTDWRVRENSNMTYSLQGLNVHITYKVISNYWLNNIYPKEIRNEHIDGAYHLHDLGTLGPYCVGWDLKDLLLSGFRGVRGKIESKPSKHLDVALLQVVNFMYTLQGEAAGAQALSEFDTLLAPFIRYDNLNFKQVKQTMQKFLFNMNVPTRTGFQTPFTNITLDLSCPNYMKNEPVIIGGEIKDKAYSEFQNEMDIFNKALTEVMMEGDAKSRPFSVDGDSLCPIKNSNRFKLIKIGEYVDDLMKKRRPTFIQENNCQVLDIRDLNIKCLGLKNGKTGWQKVNYVVRHPQKELLKITTAGGFNIKTTLSHSVLVLKEGKIQNYEASQLKEGEFLISPRFFPSEDKISVISLAHEFVKKDKAEGVYIDNVFKKGGLYEEKRSQVHKRPYGKKLYRYHHGVTLFPLKNISHGIDKFDLSKARISLSGSGTKIKNSLPITNELVEFLGWYCAEGSAEKGKFGGISLAFNLKKEKETATRLSSLIKKIFNVPVKLRKIKDRNLIEIRVHSKLVRRIITDVFEIGNKKEKKVPQIIFELSPELKKIFLRAYFKGDAWITEDIIINSISRELVYGVSTLLKQLGIFHTLTEYEWKGKSRYRVSVWQNNQLKVKDSHTISKIPLKESGLENLVKKILEKKPFYFDTSGRRYKNTKSRVFKKFGVSKQKNTGWDVAKKIVNYARSLEITIPSTLLHILEHNLSFLKIKKIEETTSSRGMVYDFSTESESFVANQLLVHNTFPIPTVNITKDFDWDKKIYDSLWEMTAKYGIPYFSNFINSDMNPDDVRSMCCRLRLDKRELKKRGGGLFGSNPLTGSIGVVTINMPRIGYKSKNEEEFLDEVGRLMDLAKESLIIKRKILERLTEKGLYPYSKFYLRGIKQGFRKYWKNHFSTIGLIGMNDALLNFYGVDIADKKGRKFAEKVLDFMREKLSDYQQETGDIFNLEATPAEGASYRLAKLDKKKYPRIKVFNQEKYDKNAEPYYTNSTQLPVGLTDDVFEALKLQDPLQTKYTGGTVLHVFLGESMPSIEATRKLVRKIAENFRLPYYTLTPTFSICPEHGYIAGEHKKCPKCGKKCEVWSRSVGYLRPVEQWNEGKQSEFKDRKTFDKQLKEV